MKMSKPNSAYVSDSILAMLNGATGRPSTVNKNSLVWDGSDPNSWHANWASAGLTYNIIVAIITANFFGRNLTTNSVFGLYFLCFVYLFLNCYYLLLIRLVATCPGNPITQMSIQNGTLWLTYRNGHITNYTHTHTHTHTHTQTHTHTHTYTRRWACGSNRRCTWKRTSLLS